MNQSFSCFVPRIPFMHKCHLMIKLGDLETHNQYHLDFGFRVFISSLLVCVCIFNTQFDKKNAERNQKTNNEYIESTTQFVQR